MSVRRSLRKFRSVRMMSLALVCLAVLSVALLLSARHLFAEPPALTVVGVLGNTSGMAAAPIPYAFYTGIAADARGRLYLAGAAEGVPVCEQDGNMLALIRLPDANARASSQFTRSGDFIFFVAQGGQGAGLYRIDTKAVDAKALTAQRVATIAGNPALSSTLDATGRVVVGQSDLTKKLYTVTAYVPASGQATVLFTLDMPKGATNPWRHLMQVDPGNKISISHLGGENFTGQYSMTGERLGNALDGQIIGQYRYFFGYDGGLRRTDLDGNAAPGDCGSNVPEIRMPAQMVQIGERYFFGGRGGAVEAKWDGTTFKYTRRIGASYIEELVDNGMTLQGVAHTTQGNNDVQHPITFPKEQPIAQLLQEDGPLHSRSIVTEVMAPEGIVYLYRRGNESRVCYDGPAHRVFDLALPEVKEIGQAAVLGDKLLLADSQSGVIWTRPLMDKQAPVTAWRENAPGIIGIATTPTAVYVANGTSVAKLTPDGKTLVWTSPETYKGIRRLAATLEAVYVCDTANNVVDQLDPATGQRVARLGEPGKAGNSLTLLNRPYAIAADPNGVYIADNGNGRVLIATTTLWKPQIVRLPREDTSPVVAATIPVKPPAQGRMSVNVYDMNGVTVRQLVCAQPSNKPVQWDGRDMYGNWAKPGTYRYYGIIAPKLSLKYVTSVEQSGTPAYRTADGTGSWGGVWGYVMDITPVNAADPQSDIVVLWAVEEGEGGMVRMSQDGKVRWKSHLDWWMKASQIGVACDGKSVYITGASALNAPEGQSNYAGDQNRPLLWRVDAATGAKQPFPGTNTENQRMFGSYLPGGRIVTDIAVHDGKVYLTAPAQNTVFVADAVSGEQLAAWPVKNASGIAFTSTGQTLVGSGNSVLALDANGGVARTMTTDAGGEIWDIEPLADGGFVATVGAPRQQVVYFDANGKETRTLGKAGGRPRVGKMDPESFRDPVGLCVTSTGMLFVAESAAPKRFTRWSADGKFQREFDGPYYYSGMFGVDEEHPEYIYADTHSDLIRYKVDYATGKWEVDRYWIGAYADSGIPIKWWPRIRHRNGNTYWCSGSGAIVELFDDHVRAVAAVYGGWVEKQADGNYTQVNKNTGLKGAWSDLNGDGKMQPEEWQVTDKPVYPMTDGGPQQGWGTYFDENFNLYMHDWSDGAAGGVWEIPVVEWQNDTPVYRWDKAVHAGDARGNGLLHGASGARTAFAAGGAVYGFNGGYNAAGLPGVGHGHDFEFAQITKYDPKTGKPLWHAGQRSPGFAQPGEMYCPTGPAGLLGDYLCWTDENSLVHVWDAQHGLYVDTLLDDVSRDPKPSPYTVWVELFNTRVFRNVQNGKVYLMAASDAIHIYEVQGMDKAPIPFSGTFTLTAQGLAAAQAKVASRTVEDTRSMKIAQATRPVVVDGNIAEFANADVVSLALKPTASAKAGLLYDDKNLYVAFDVKDESPWKNAGGDINTLFKTGDTLDLWLGPSAGKRAPGLGDVRILFAPNGAAGNVVVAYRPKVAQGTAKPVTFRSPAQQLVMDRVEQLKDVTVAVAPTPTGYRLEAAIPRSEIGLTGDPGKFGLDISVNFSDPAGQRNVARIHWARNGAAIVYDIPTEARLEPDTWGTAVLVK